MMSEMLVFMVLISFMLMTICFEKSCSNNTYVDSRCGTVKAVFVL
jgi:hypothetical protein